MYTWEIMGGGLPHIWIRAACFDDAIKQARERNPRYCGGFIVDDEVICLDE